jgi:hypothetical protein
MKAVRLRCEGAELAPVEGGLCGAEAALAGVSHGLVFNMHVCQSQQQAV